MWMGNPDTSGMGTQFNNADGNQPCTRTPAAPTELIWMVSTSSPKRAGVALQPLSDHPSINWVGSALIADDILSAVSGVL